MNKFSCNYHSAVEVKSALLEKIRQLEVGTRLAPERQLAETYGISRSTMSKVLTELETEGILVRRVGKGTFIMPRDAMVTPAAAHPGQAEVLLAYPDFFSYGIWQQVHQLEVEAMRNGLQLNHLHIQPESDLNALLRLAQKSKKLRGIVMIAGVPFRKQLLEDLDSIGVPVIFLGDVSDLGLYRNCHTVRSNHFVSGYLKLELLLRNGHRKIGLIHNEPPTLAWQENMRGLKAAARDFKLPWRSLVQPDSRVDYWQDSQEGGYLQTLEVMRKAPELTGLVVDTTPGAIGALRALYELGIRCPDQVSISTALANAQLEEYTCPKLSTAVVPTGLMTKIVIDLLLGRHPVASRENRLDPIMIERESVRDLNRKESFS